jgi:hypothetical protein
MQAHGHEGILERRPRASMRMDIPAGYTRQAELLGQARKTAIPGAIVAQKRPLELDSEPVGTECLQQPAETRLVVDPAQGASAEADQALGTSSHLL